MIRCSGSATWGVAIWSSKRIQLITLGISDRENQWRKNISSNAYDLNALGTWQYLAAEAEIPARASQGQIMIEKGSFHRTIEAVIYLRDLRLELLEEL